MQQQVNRINIRIFKKYTIIKENKVLAKLINKIIRINDAIEME